ncbi:MAG: glycoside hydrolase family 2 TIM barrel-domain containing protein [Mucinivorans sp.]
MKNTIQVTVLLLFMSYCAACAQQLPTDTRKHISLEGKWGVGLDTTRAGFADNAYTLTFTDSLWLPGTTDIGKIGSYNADTNQTNFLSREYQFEGKTLYTKTVKIPSDWKGTSIRLFMERTKPTRIWIDGKAAGRNDDISTPQQYDLSTYLSPGTHTLAIEVDNAMAVPEKVFYSSHAYSSSTQTNWNGIIGDFYLESAPLCGIDYIQVYPDVARKQITVKVLFRTSGVTATKGQLSLYAEAFNSNTKHHTAVRTVDVNVNGEAQTFTLEMGEEALLWSEFTPALYRLSVSLRTNKGVDTEQTTFGLRTFEAKGTQFAINNKITFLRGKNDACVFPLTAHVAMDVDTWRHYFQVAKQYGINHYRFHSWCPPEACFQAADLEGIYLQPELPIWGVIEVQDKQLCDYLLKEGINLHKAYSNHASFVMFALGNEMGGQQALSMLMDTLKKTDPRHLYAAGSNNFLGIKGKQAGEQFYTTCRVGREQEGTFDTHTRASFSFADAYDGGYLNHTYPNSTMNFATAVALCDVPIVGHETGQYQIYPNYDEMKKYTGVLKPRNFEVFRKRLDAAGLGAQAHQFMMASGKWSALLYRADIEMNLRTPGLAGFQLLDLQDYPGQGSAYVGILDAFMDSKGLIAPEQWHNFCREVVPLFCTEKFCWTNDETLTGEIRIANYGSNDLKDKQLFWVLTDSQQQTLGHGTFPLQVDQGKLGLVGTLRTTLANLSKAQKVNLALSIEDTPYQNNYPLWIYPANNQPELTQELLVATDLDAAMLNKLNEGGKVLWFPSKEKYLEQTLGGLFQTDYWNYRMFKTICDNIKCASSPGTLGILTDPKHPALTDFPSEFYTTWQWFPILKESRPMILDRLPNDYMPIVQVIDNVERNHKLGLLFEFKVGAGKLLVCMSDLKAVQDKPEARQFYSSLLKYMHSADFTPTYPLSSDELKDLFSSTSRSNRIERLKNISYE